MPDWAHNILFPLVRWVHLVCMTLIVGGTLFFELVLPLSIDDLKREQQLFAFARARLVWRWVVWISVVGLLLSGAVSLWRIFPAYWRGEFYMYMGRWVLAHVAIGLIGLAFALLLTVGRRPPENPVRWMRLNLIVLLVTIFLGSAARHFQFAISEGGQRTGNSGKVPAEIMPPRPSTTEPSTRPAGR